MENPYLCHKLPVADKLPVAEELAEDTPRLAVERWLEVRSLKDKLVKMTRGCDVIQKEPSKALCRYLFSSKLAEGQGGASTKCKKIARDPLLSNLADGVYYDKSICKELKHKPELAREVCDELCRASREAVARLEWEKGHNDTEKVEISQEGGDLWRVSYGAVDHLGFPPKISICIEDKLLTRLHRMYRRTSFRPFIVLTETKFSKRHIPVWARYSPLRTRVEAHANTLSP
jgi:hypothetical protein